MSAQPGRTGMGAPENQGLKLAWSALFVAASLLGGLAAADITHKSSVVAVLVSLAVAAVMVSLLYAGLLDQTRRAGLGDVPVGTRGGMGGGQHRQGADTQPPADSQTQQGGQLPPAESVAPGAVRLVQPGGQSDGGWWEGHEPTRPAGRAASRPAPRTVNLSQFLDKAQIAQCPACGAFHVDVDNRAAEWLFVCQECRQRWTWQPGTAWPVIQVRPEARGRSHRPRA